jgi:hypothetical protein
VNKSELSQIGRKPVLESDLHALRTAAARLEGLLASAGVEEEQVVED